MAASIMVSAIRFFVPEPVPVCVPEIGHGHGHAHAHGHELSRGSLRGRIHDQRRDGAPETPAEHRQKVEVAWLFV